MDENEVILRQTENLKKLNRSELYRTKDIYLTAFFLARGLEWIAMEEVQVTKKNKNSVRTNKFIYFLFEDKNLCERLTIHYHNGNRVNLNVNTNSFVRSYLNIRSIITDPHF